MRVVDSREDGGEGAPVTWETELLALFDDLEQQAAGLAMAQRDAEVAELARAEYAEVTLADRLHGSVGSRVELVVTGAGVLRGRLAGAGAGWCLVADELGSPQEWVVPTGAVTALRGLAPRSRPEAARPVTARLGLGSVLRRLAEQRDTVQLVRVDGERRNGRLGRIGADFLELVSPDAGVEVVPMTAVAALRSVA
jgi:hypothetical protein